MKDNKSIKEIVKEKYGQIAEQSASVNRTSCCGAGGNCDVDYSIFSEDYTNLDGYFADADLGLGCGLPTEFAGIKEGDIVVDLGSGAGNDCFVARELAGVSGQVIGIDMTESMIQKARQNAEKMGFGNVSFMLGEIEDLPLKENLVDVVVSNCVLNLVPDKTKAFVEIFRVLKPGGRFSISDVVIQGELPDDLKEAAEMYAGCVSGALQRDQYIGIIEKTGFSEIKIEREREINVPDEILLNYIDSKQLDNLKSSNTGIFSITVTAIKP